MKKSYSVFADDVAKEYNVTLEKMKKLKCHKKEERRRRYTRYNFIIILLSILVEEVEDEEEEELPFGILYS